MKPEPAARASDIRDPRLVPKATSKGHLGEAGLTRSWSDQHPMKSTPDVETTPEANSEGPVDEAQRVAGGSKLLTPVPSHEQTTQR
ncbi:hypothetical protein HID58_048712 [Brassica napus]|uniref:Uncharacterized protein n=1 Tax=Brassica napus TaxID=3708 RepID=A0ABQ8B2X1_BRANA|nr:hypothetical protein HID58_048712 [Brassica napus]